MSEDTSRVNCVATHLVLRRKPVEEMLRCNPERVRRCWVLRGSRMGNELRDILTKVGVPLQVLGREELDKKAGSTEHQGIVAEISSKHEMTFDDVVEQSLSEKGHRLLVVCDHIADPHNLGAVLRVCEAAGVDGVFATKDHSAPLSSAAKRSSAGASEFIPFVLVTNLRRCLEQLKQKGFWVVGLEVGEETPCLFDVDISFPCVVVLGAEGKGMRRLTRDACDILVSIPMQGNIASLNVSQAASVFLYELLRRQR